MELSHLDLATEVCGRGFSLAERAAIEATAVDLLHRSKHTTALVWGKVYGQKADYLVLLGHSGDPFGKDAAVFVSTDGGVSFATLPMPNESFLARLAANQPDDADEPVVPVTIPSLFTRASQSGALAGPFIGDPAYEYRVPDALSRGVYVMKEAERLGCFVALQLRQGRVTPRGAYQRRQADAPAHRQGKQEAAAATGADLFTVRANSAFSGLDAAASVRLSSYVHLRRETKQRHSLETEGVATHLDWLDSLSEDEPAGCWSLQFRHAAGVAVGSALELLGSSFYHAPHSAVFGSLYMGDGNVNRDLPFML
jgi:radial spoke head protein 9